MRQRVFPQNNSLPQTDLPASTPAKGFTSFDTALSSRRAFLARLDSQPDTLGMAIEVSLPIMHDQAVLSRHCRRLVRRGGEKSAQQRYERAQALHACAHARATSRLPAPICIVSLIIFPAGGVC